MPSRGPWSMRNGRHLGTSLVESSVAHAVSSRISGNSQTASRHLGKLGQRLSRARDLPEHSQAKPDVDRSTIEP